MGRLWALNSRSKGTRPQQVTRTRRPKTGNRHFRRSRSSIAAQVGTCVYMPRRFEGYINHSFLKNRSFTPMAKHFQTIRLRLRRQATQSNECMLANEHNYPSIPWPWNGFMLATRTKSAVRNTSWLAGWMFGMYALNFKDLKGDICVIKRISLRLYIIYCLLARMDQT